MKHFGTSVVFAGLLFVAGLLFAAACGADEPLGQGGQDDGQPLGGGPYPVATLDITISHPEADPVSYIVSCLGDTATITPAVDGLNEMNACLALKLAQVQDLLINGPDPDRICTEIYGGPDEAMIVGAIDDEPVDTVITRNNGCGIADWDNTLGAILPPARGAF